MPKAWSEKKERQYEHIKESAKERGKSEKRAKEIAARTVNKQRRKEGKTENKTTQGTGNPNTSLENRKVEELRNRARQLDLNNYNQLTKKELINEIRRAS